MRAYRQSKLAQILFTIDLAPELQGSGVTVNALHPATFMDTTMVRQFGTPISTVEEGADAILKLAVAPGNGRPQRALLQRTERRRAPTPRLMTRRRGKSLSSTELSSLPDCPRRNRAAAPR